MKKVLIFIFLLGIISILSGCVNIFTVDYYNDSDKYVVGSLDYQVELYTLDIDWVFGKVTLIEDENATKISIKEENELPDTIKVHSYFTDGTLYVKFGEAGYKGSGIKSSEKNLEITYKNLNDINIKLTSGTLVAEKINATNANIVITSGSINIDTINASILDIKLTSGKITLDNAVVTDLNVDMASGSFIVSSLSCDSIDCVQTSGNCNIGLKECRKGDLKETSGSITLTIPEDTKTKIILNKTSGSLRTDKTFTRVDNEYTFGPIDKDITSTITIKVTSGSVRIK